jgi:hypothetical protein
MAAQTKIDIANTALADLGVALVIQSFDERSVQAQACRANFTASADVALERHNWSFARKRAVLADHPDGATEDWQFRYVYPSDCLALRGFVLADKTIDLPPLELNAASDGALSILTNWPSATAVYTFRQNLIQAWTPSFCDYVAAVLASRIAVRLTGKRALRQDMLELADFRFRQASAMNANEEVAGPDRDSELIRGRL